MMLNNMRYFLASLLVSGSIAAAALAQQPTQGLASEANSPEVTTASYGDWVLRCARLPLAGTDEAAPGEACEVIVSMFVQGQAEPVAQLAIGYKLEEAAGLVATAVLPSNIGIPGSVQVVSNASVDGDGAGVIALQWTRCMGGRCFATTPLTEEEIAGLRPDDRNAEGAVRFETAAGQVVSIPVPWKGFESALAALKATKT
ncbi:invasion associated locus B family protein [Hoeflea olei]|uniref:Invasion protein n=1 Tax=Hoeflea olei TaxID=1480615 RepID=A0A1C1YVF0_9HYPH|nr:invasion associated locus B family protein [Hoeflea olei]OCW57429.1 hypothetical protein AWJ14_00850 [Hoeflea olei]